MSKRPLTLRPPPRTRDNPYWLDVPAQPWRNTWTPTERAPVDPLEYTTSTPSRVPSWQADVLVPCGQSLFTALFVGLLSGAIAIWQAWPWQVPAMLAAISAALMWFSSVADTRALLRRVEVWTGKDLDRDGIVGDPERVIHEYHVKDDSQSGAHWQMMISLDIDPERLRQFAKGLVVEGRSTGTSTWTGQRGLFERTEFEQLRDELISRGFAKWSKSRNRGWYLTSKGKSWFTALADELE